MAQENGNNNRPPEQGQGSNAQPQQGASQTTTPNDAAQAKPDDKQMSLLQESYVCVKECFYKSRFFHEGDPLIAPSGTKVPNHFKKV